MESSIKIRRFEDSDRERVVQIEGTAPTELTPLSSLRASYEIPSDGFIVAEVDGRVVGFLVADERRVSRGGSEGHILSIAVDRQCRRKGIGAALVASIIDILRTKSIGKVTLEVKTSNQRAIGFYKHLGFEESHLLRRYYKMRGYTEDALLMSKRI